MLAELVEYKQPSVMKKKEIKVSKKSGLRIIPI
jgi:hypothetical protein